MRLLLDTHIWLWSLLEPGKLSRRVSKALESQSNELWLSPVSTWEFFVLARRKRIVLDGDPEQWLRRATAAAPLREATFTSQVAVESITRIGNPIHRVAGANGDGEWLEAILLGHDDHPVMPAVLRRPDPRDEAEYGEERQQGGDRGEPSDPHGDLLSTV